MAAVVNGYVRRFALGSVAVLGLTGPAASSASAHMINDFPTSRADRTLAAFAEFNIHGHEALRRCAAVVDRNDLIKPDSLIKIVTYDISYMWANIRSILGPGRDPKRDPKVLVVRVFYAQTVEAIRIKLAGRFEGVPVAKLATRCDAERRLLLKKLPRFRRLHKVIVNGVAQ